MADGTLVKPDLTVEMIHVGAAFIRALDAAGMVFPAAFWWFHMERSDWTLVLVSPEFGVVGPLTLYGRVHPILDGLPDNVEKRSLPLMRVTVMDVREPVVTAIAALVKTGMDITGIRLTNEVANRFMVSDAYVYRQTL